MSLTNPVEMDCSVPGACPLLSAHGSSLAEMTKEGISQHAKITKRQNMTNKKLAGGKRSATPVQTHIAVPQSSANSGGTVVAGGSNADTNMKNSYGHTLNQKAEATYDNLALKLPITGGKKTRKKSSKLS